MGEFYTVTEYSRITGKDTGNIRRMLINGTLKGEKVGNQWLIDKENGFPQDRRVKSGKYRNWRQKNEFCKRNPELVKTLKEMCDRLSILYADSLEEILLYGSYARGEESTESDVDIALILKSDQTEVEHEEMADIVVDFELEIGKTLSVIPLEYSQFQEWKEDLPFYKNIQKEGIVIWRTA